MKYTHIVLWTSSIWKKYKNGKKAYLRLMFIAMKALCFKQQCPSQQEETKSLLLKEQRQKRTRWILGLSCNYEVSNGFAHFLGETINASPMYLIYERKKIKNFAKGGLLQIHIFVYRISML